MWQEMEQIAGIVFTASALIMAIALVLISSSWKTLKEIMSTLPRNQKKIIFVLKKITNERRKYKEELKGALWLSILFLGITIFANMGSMLCCVRTMLRMHGGILGEISITYELQDFTVAKWSLIISVISLFMALFCLGFYRISEFLAFRKGKLNIIKELSTKSRVNKKNE